MAAIDLTVYAEALIATTARAFYDDDVVCLIDVLLRDKFLRDDDMAPRLHLPARQLRRTLQFLEEQLLVKHELVDDLSSGGSQNTKFWYIDYNMAVLVIRLRIHLLQTKLQSSELRARSSSLYLCPGYKHQRCNGKYTETDAQRMVDPNSGRFLCRECVRAFTNHPNAPPVEEYTLQLVDNQVELKSAMDNLRRVNVQFSSKMESIGGGGEGSNQQQQQQQRPLRQGIFELLQKVRPIRGAEPITSNLPSENIAMGVGSKRLVGTGRTAKNLITKLVKQGIVSADGGPGRRGGGTYYDTDELTFLKNAMGQEIAFELERGGGARANLLCTKGKIRNKLLDAAARKVGVDLGLVSRVLLEERERLKRKREEKEREDENGGGKKKKKKKAGVQEFDFLQDNLGESAWDGGQLTKEEKEKRRLAYLGGDDDSSDDEDFEAKMATNILPDETDELRNLPENDFRAAFQQQYKMEVERQMKLLGLKSLDDLMPSLEEDEDIDWEDG
ncbi:hypothetical protein ACHAWT_007607 [Skeletonema menzelii]